MEATITGWGGGGGMCSMDLPQGGLELPDLFKSCEDVLNKMEQLVKKKAIDEP